MKTEKIKIALFREEGYPIGFPAPMYATCVCGTRIDNLNFQNLFSCQVCKRNYTGDGWVIKEKQWPY